MVLVLRFGEALIVVQLLLLKLVPVEMCRSELQLLGLELTNKHSVVLPEYIVQVHLGAQSLVGLHQVYVVEKLLVL